MSVRKHDGCSVENCPGEHHGRGMCHRHYKQFMETENPRGCDYPGCPKRHKAKGYCTEHHNRWYLYGDPAPRETVRTPESYESQSRAARERRAALSPEERSRMVSQGNRSRRLKRLGLPPYDQQ